MKFSKFIISAILVVILFSTIVAGDVLHDTVVSDTNAKDLPCVATISDDTVMVAWADNTAGDAKYSIFNPTDGTWSAPATITGSSIGGVTDLSLTQDFSGDVLAAWLGGGNTEANFYSGGWGAKTTWAEPNGVSIATVYDQTNDAWSVITAHTGIVQDFNIVTYAQGALEGVPDWDAQTVDLTDFERLPNNNTDMSTPSVIYDPIVNQLVVTYHDLTSGDAMSLIPTSWEANFGLYGTGDGHDWGVPTTITGTALMVAPGRMHINRSSGNGAYAYENSANEVYVTDYTGGAFPGPEEQVSTENPDDGSVLISYFDDGDPADDGGVVTWTNTNNLRFHLLDNAGDATGADTTAVTGVVLTQGTSMTNNASAGQPASLNSVITDGGGGNIDPKLVPIDPGDITPTNSNITETPGDTTCTIEWDTDLPTGNALIRYEDVTPPTDTQAETDTTAHKDHTVDIAGLTSGTTYYYEIDQNPWGNTGSFIDDNSGTYYDFDTTGGGAGGTGYGAAPGLEIVGLAIVAVSGLAVFVIMRKR